MANEIAVRQGGDLAVDGYRPRGIIELAQSKAVIQHVMKAIMKGPSPQNKMGVHYGVIPGTPKPTLYKPGSELILSLFRIAVDMDVEDLSTEDVIRYRVKAIGKLPDGAVVGYGIGECSTDEEKYKWKKPVCDEEYEATDPTRRREKFGKGEGGKAYKTKQIRTNPADLANTVLKMAKKRAQIDLTLTATGASDVFDQDLEDLKDVIDITEYQKKGGKPEVTPPGATGGERPATGGGEPAGNGSGTGSKFAPGDRVKPGGAALVRGKLEARGVSEREFCAFMQILTVDDLLSGDMNRGIKAIEAGEIPALGAES